MPVVDLPHMFRVRPGIRRQRRADLSHERDRGPEGAQRPSTSASSPNGLLNPCRSPRGATNIEPATASSGSPSLNTCSRPFST